MPADNFLIAEDHVLTTMGYKLLLQTAYPDCSCRFVRTVKELREALDQQGHQFTCAIWDMQLMDDDLLNHISFIEESAKRFPNMPILTVTTKYRLKFADLLYIAGIKGFLVKESRESEVRTAIQAICAGEIYESDLLRDYRALIAEDEEPEKPDKNKPFLS